MGTLDNGDADLSPRGKPVASLMRSCLGDNHSLVRQWTLEVFPTLFTWFLWTNRGFPSQYPVSGGQVRFYFINSDDS